MSHPNFDGHYQIQNWDLCWVNHFSPSKSISVLNVFSIKGLLYLPGSSASMYVFALHGCVSLGEQEKVSDGTGGTDRCEPPCGLWECSPGGLGKQTVLLTTAPSLYRNGTIALSPLTYRNFSHMAYTLVAA